MRNIVFISICFFCLNIYCEAQKSEIDSLYETLDSYTKKVDAPDSLVYEIISLSIRKGIKRIEPYLEELKDISVKKDSFFIQKINYATAHLERTKGNLDESERLFTNYINFFEQKVPSQYPCDAYFYLGNLLFFKKSFNKSLYYLIRGKDQAIKKHPEWIPPMITLLGEVYRRLKYYDKAIESYHLVLENGEIHITYRLRATMYIADTYFESGKIDSARIYAVKLFDLAQESGIDNFINRSKLLIAQADFESGKFQLAATSCSKLLDFFFLESRNRYGVYQVRKILGQSLIALGKYTEAQKVFEEYKYISSKNKNLENQKIALSGLIDCYQKMDNKSQLVNTYKQMIVVQDSLNIRSREEKLLDLSAEFELELKTNDLKLVERENEINKLQAERAQRNNNFALIGLFFLALFSIFLYWAFSNQRKSKKALAESLADKELLLKEIHHRVKNNLQVVSSLLGLQSEYIKDESALSAINEGRNRVRSMSLIHQNLYKGHNLKGIGMKSYLDKLISGLFDTYNINAEKIKLSLTIQDIELDVDTVVPLGLITNELVSNALKHAFKIKKEGAISVSLQENGKVLELIVSDNGDGIDSTLINEDIASFGYQMIYAFKEKLNAELDINSAHGTSIKLTILEYQKI